MGGDDLSSWRSVGLLWIGCEFRHSALGITLAHGFKKRQNFLGNVAGTTAGFVHPLGAWTRLVGER